MKNPDDQKKTGLIIPYQKLSVDALSSLIEEFILREGTDYGSREYTLEEKKEQIFKQLKANHIVILFDTELETTTLYKRDQLSKLSQQGLTL